MAYKLKFDPNTGRIMLVSDLAGTGDVIGPATNTDSYIPQWDGADSKALKDGLAVPAGGLAGLTDLGGKEDVSNKDSTTSLGTSNTKYPSQNAVKVYTDTKIPYTVATDTYFTTGILDKSVTSISFDKATTTFTIAPTGASFDIYLSGVKYTKSTPQTLDISTVPGFGANKQIFIYFNPSATLAGSIAAWDITSSTAPVATVFWNGSAGVLADERHGAIRNLAWHKWAHNTLGTQYKSGLACSFTDSATTVGSGVIQDEDLVISVSGQSSVRNWYLSSGGTTMTFDETAVNASAHIVAGALKWDNGGTITSVTDGSFVRNFVYATDDVDVPIAVITGRAEYTNIDDARVSAFPTLPNIQVAEYKLIYTTTWKNVGGTPTFIESIDYRIATGTPNGGIAEHPVYLNDLSNVSATNPSIDNVLKWNGISWVPGAPVSSSASNGIDFYFSSPTITSASTDNATRICTLSKTPTTTAEQTVTGAINAATSPIAAWIYDTPLGRTSIDSGVWDFETYAGVNSTAAGRVSTVTRQLYSVLTQDGASYTVTTTGTLASRTLTSSGGTPFAIAKIDASAVNITASFVQTPKGIYQITARISDTQVTISTPTTYVNESTVTFNVWKKLFGSTSPTITAISPAYALYSHTSVQPSFTITTSHKLGSITFGTTTALTTITVTYDGTTHNSHVTTPLVTLHNNLAGLQGGTSNEYYHITSAQATVLGNTSGTNSGDNAANSTYSNVDNTSDATKNSAVAILTNKAITPRKVTTTDDATAVIDVAVTDVYELTAVANATVFTVTGSAVDGQKLLIRYLDAGVTKNLTFTGFTAVGVTIPTATTPSKWGYVGAIFNQTASSWQIVAVGTQA